MRGLLPSCVRPRKSDVCDSQKTLVTAIDASSRALEAAAREAWADLAEGRRWTLFARLSFARQVSEAIVNRSLEDWAVKLLARAPGSAAIAGVHDDTSRLHVHALVFLPERIARPSYPPGVEVVRWNWEAWLRLDWKHGQVWADWFSPARAECSARDPALYISRFPGTVVRWGAAPPYCPRRRKRERRPGSCA